MIESIAGFERTWTEPTTSTSKALDGMTDSRAAAIRAAYEHASRSVIPAI